MSFEELAEIISYLCTAETMIAKKTNGSQQEAKNNHSVRYSFLKCLNDKGLLFVADLLEKELDAPGPIKFVVKHRPDSAMDEHVDDEEPEGKCHTYRKILFSKQLRLFFVAKSKKYLKEMFEAMTTAILFFRSIVAHYAVNRMAQLAIKDDDKNSALGSRINQTATRSTGSK